MVGMLVASRHVVGVLLAHGRGVLVFLLFRGFRLGVVVIAPS